VPLNPFFCCDLEPQQGLSEGKVELVHLAPACTAPLGVAFLGVGEPVQQMGVDEVARQPRRQPRQPARMRLTGTKSFGSDEPTRPNGTESVTVDEGLELGEMLDSPAEESEGCTVGRPASFW
jgi:hypothetical protein